MTADIHPITRTFRVAVYGTLRLGGHLHPHWLADARHVAVTTTPGRLWEVHPHGGYPVARFGARFHPSRVTVDVFDVDADAWAAVSRMERGAGYAIDRIHLRGVGDVLVFGWPEGRRTGPPVDGGDWLAHTAAGREVTA